MGKPRKEREAPRIQRIELSEKNIKLRWILAGALLLIGLVAIAIGVNSCISAQVGWQEVQITANKTNCSTDFVFNYDYGQAGVEPYQERRQVIACYSEAVVEAYELFNTHVENSDMGNLTLLGASPNQTVSVEPELYQTLQQIVDSESRYVYLAAVYEEYSRIFRADSEIHAAEYDPSKNAELLPYVQEAASFANDPAHISMELLGEGKVRLVVSDAYLAFAEKYGITCFLDLGWMKNAFIIDFLAQRLVDAGYTNGYLASFDGYTRNLDQRGESYNFNLFDRVNSDIHMPAIMEYAEPMSIVFLRNFPMSSRDSEQYYLFSDNTIATTFIDPADGLYKSATDNLVAYSTKTGCAAIALELAPVFVADSLDAEAIRDLTKREIYSVWFDGSKLQHTEERCKVTLQPVEGISYQAHYAGN